MSQTGQPVSCPVLPLQQAMLYHLLADPRCGVEVTQIVGVIPEPLDFPLFAAAWQRVMDRHDILRASFCWRPGEAPVQRFWPNASAAVRYLDWRAVPREDVESRMAGFLEEDLRADVVLDRCPLWRVTVVEVSDREFHFVVTGLHALLDGHSLYLGVDEVFQFYDGSRAGRDIQLTDAPSFASFVQWSQQRGSDGDEGYWRKRLCGFEGSRLPAFSSKATTFNACPETTVLPDELATLVRRLARAHRATPNTLIKAAWALVLGRWTGCSDVAFGEVQAGRGNTVAGAGAIMGLFINTPPVRVVLTPGLTVSELLEGLRETQRAMRGHERAALHDIQRWSGLPHGTPLFESVIVFSESDFGHLFQKRGGWWSNRRICVMDHTSMPLTLHAWMEPRLTLRLLGNRSRVAPEVLQEMLEGLRLVLEAFVADPSQRVDGIEVLTEPHRELLVSTWNTTDETLPEEDTLVSLWERQVRATPERPAVVQGEVRRTYREIEEQAARWAAVLRGAGAGPDRLMGICLDRSADLLPALLAILKSGAAYVPLDPAHPEERLKCMVDDACPVAIVTSRQLAGRFTGEAPPRISVEDLDGATPVEGEAVVAAVRPGHLAYVIHTSGSTGRPKGVMITHRNVVNCFLGMDRLMGSPASGTWLSVTSICFDISVLELFYTLTRGFTVVLAAEPGREDSLSPLQLLERHEITHFQCTPSLMRLMIQNASARETLGRLRVLLLGGEMLPPDLLAALGHVPGRTILNVYGPTETTIWSTAAIVKAGERPVPIGRPLVNTRLYVVDDALRLCPTGVPGELLIGGEGVARGYLNQDALTAERFLPDPFRPQGDGRVYRTGDKVCYRENGVLECLGRLDHQIKLFGHRIEPGEIETSLREVAGVKDAVVTLHNTASGDPRLLCLVVPASSTAPSDQVLRAHLARRLPVRAIPQEFVMLNAFPLTPNGKLDRKALPLPQAQSARRTSRFIAPRNAVEAQLAGMWKRVLGVERVGAHDDFFDLGGDSVAVARLCVAIRQRVGMEVSLGTVFAHPTLAALAGALRPASEPSPTGWASVERDRSDCPGPILFALHGVENIFGRLRDHVAPDRPVVTLTARVGFDGRMPPYHPCRSVEDMAVHYLTDVRAIQPRGPYYFIGFCLGGLIAYEMARQLRAQQEEVAFLGLVNALPYDQDEVRRQRERINGRLRAILCLRNLDEHLPAAICAAGRLLRSTPARLRAAVARKLYPNYVRLGGTVSPDFVLRQVGLHGWRMVTRYQPRPYAGRVTLFGGSHAPADSYDRWARLALGGLEVHQFDAGHYGMMAEPVVRELAAAMNAALAVEQAPAHVPAEASREPDHRPARAVGSVYASPVAPKHA